MGSEQRCCGMMRTTNPIAMSGCGYECPLCGGFMRCCVCLLSLGVVSRMRREYVGASVLYTNSNVFPSSLPSDTLCLSDQDIVIFVFGWNGVSFFRLFGCYYALSEPYCSQLRNVSNDMKSTMGGALYRCSMRSTFFSAFIGGLSVSLCQKFGIFICDAILYACNAIFRFTSSDSPSLHGRIEMLWLREIDKILPSPRFFPATVNELLNHAIQGHQLSFISNSLSIRFSNPLLLVHNSTLEHWTQHHYCITSRDFC